MVKKIAILGIAFNALNIISGIIVFVETSQREITLISIICSVITIIILIALLLKQNNSQKQ